MQVVVKVYICVFFEFECNCSYHDLQKLLEVSEVQWPRRGEKSLDPEICGGPQWY